MTGETLVLTPVEFIFTYGLCLLESSCVSSYPPMITVLSLLLNYICIFRCKTIIELCILNDMHKYRSLYHVGFSHRQRRGSNEVAHLVLIRLHFTETARTEPVELRSCIAWHTRHWQRIFPLTIADMNKTYRRAGALYPEKLVCKAYPFISMNIIKKNEIRYIAHDNGFKIRSTRRYEDTFETRIVLFILYRSVAMGIQRRATSTRGLQAELQSFLTQATQRWVC